ncbi:MBL fold metallo-hydrolase [Halovenus salina]|uniref:MBL fold metallo-hydrolase n=1 Tax=Halovenus salina TaxID=1510225 RepID=A0ABD5VVA6_9EURY|nr:MBL fold metallo-hydrolase [Halovenus salina]
MSKTDAQEHNTSIDTKPMKRRAFLRAAAGTGVILAVVVLGLVASPASAANSGDGDGMVNLTALDVGQGDAYVIWSENETMVVDSGDYTDNGEQVIKYVSETLNRTTIDYLVSTHPDADHIGGHEDIIDHFENSTDGGIGEVWRSGMSSPSATFAGYNNSISANSIPDNLARQGDIIPFEAADVEVAFPKADPADSSPNDDSVALYIQDNGSEMLLLGDLPSEEQNEVINYLPHALDGVDLYESPHHGASSSTDATVINYLDPSLSLVSAPYDSSYGHPNNETLSALADSEIPTVWTGIHGTTTVVNNGDGVLDVLTQANVTTNTTEMKTFPSDTTASESPTAWNITAQQPLDTFSKTDDSPVVAAPTDGGSSDGLPVWQLGFGGLIAFFGGAIWRVR